MLFVERVGLLVGVGGVEDCGLGEMAPCELEAYGKADVVKSAGDGDGWAASEVENDVRIAAGGVQEGHGIEFGEGYGGAVCGGAGNEVDFVEDFGDFSLQAAAHSLGLNVVAGGEKGSGKQECLDGLAEFFGTVVEVFLENVVTLGDVDGRSSCTGVLQVRDLYVYYFCAHLSQVQDCLVDGSLCFGLYGSRVLIEVAAEDTDFETAHVAGKQSAIVRYGGRGCGGITGVGAGDGLQHYGRVFDGAAHGPDVVHGPA